jgi:hypothetical protein
MYCTSCGSRNPEGAQFCAKCGSQTVDLSEKLADSQPNLQPNSIEHVPPSALQEHTSGKSGTTKKGSPGTTYVWLGIEVISACVLIACALFWLARMVTSGNPELQNQLTGSSGVIIGLFWVSFALSRSWKRLQVLEPDSEPIFRKKHRRFNQIAGGFAVLCSAAAIAVGTQRGNCDAAISRFGADVNQTVDVMQAVGKVRSGAGDTIEEHVEMYRSIEPKVVQARTTLARLHTEIPRCGDFQSRVGRFEFILNNFDQRFALLTREIEVSKSIESSPANERERKWQSELVPLVDQEVSLEKQLQTIK